MAENNLDIEINNFAGGLVTTEDDMEIQDNQMTSGSQNVLASISKTTSRKGYAKDNSSALGTSLAVTSIFDGVNHVMVSTSDGQVWRRTGAGTYTSTGSGFANSALSWTSYNALDVFCDGTNAPRKWNGTTLATLGGTPPSGDACEIFRDHLFILDRDTAELRFSVQGDIETWPATHSIQVDKNTREKNRAFITTRDRLIVWKQRSIHHIAGTHILDFERIPVSQGVGAVHHNAVFNLSGSPNPQWAGLYWVDQSGFYFSPDAGVTCIKLSDFPGKSIQASFDALSSSNIANARVGVDRSNNLILFCVPKSGATNDTVYAWDYRLGIWQAEFTNMNFSAFAEISSSGTFLTYAGESRTATGAFIYQLNSGTSDAGTAIAAAIRTKRFDFGRPFDQHKIVDKILTLQETSAATNMTVKAFWDFSSSADQTDTISMALNRGNARYNKTVGAVQWDLSWSSSTLTPALKRATVRARPGGQPAE